MSERPNVSADLIWEVVRNQNAFLVKRRSGGGVMFSRDPLNLRNKHSYKNAGFVNDKAVGLIPHEKGGVTLITKISKNAHRPDAQHSHTTWNSQHSNQKTFKGIASHTAKKNYRADLREDAISRASALKNSQRQKRDTPDKKPRGSKAKKAVEKE